MGPCLLRGLFQTLLTLFIVTIISFVICIMLPGDPTLSMVSSEGVSEEFLQAYRQELGLDQLHYVQYGRWLGAVLSGDFGVSIRTRVEVLTLFGQCLPMTLQLLGMGVLWALMIAVPIGIFSAIRPGTWLDSLGTVLAVSGVAMPQFLLAWC